MEKVQGWVEQGNTTLSIGGATGVIARKVQGSYPGATVTVYINSAPGVVISAISRTSNVVTVTVASGSGFIAGQLVAILGVTDASFDGTFTIISTSATQFTYAQTAANASSSGGYATSTLRLASIYSDDNAVPTAKANPFVSASDGTWFFYATNGIYDIKFSGAGIAAPFTIGGVSTGLGSAGVPSYPFASLPFAKTQDLGNLVRLSDSVRGLLMNGVDGYAQVGYGLVNVAEFSEAGTGAKINAAVAALAGSIGAVIVPPQLASGEGNQLPDNAILIDFRGTAASQGLRFNVSAAVAGGIRNKILLQDNWSAINTLTNPNQGSATAYVFSYVDDPQYSVNTIAAFNATMATNTQNGTYAGVLVGIEGEAFANSTNAAPQICVDVRGGTFNSFCGGNTIVNNIRSLVAQAPVNQNPGTSVVHNAFSLIVEGFSGVGDTTNWPFWCTGLAVIDGVLALGNQLPNLSVGLISRHHDLIGTSQFGIQSAPIASSAATGAGVGVVGRCDTAAAVFTQTINAGFYAQNPTKGAGSTITLSAGLYIEDQTRGAANYGIYSLHTGEHFLTGYLSSSYIKMRVATPATGIGAGELGFGVSTSSTIGANGAATALTANPLGYLKVNLQGTMVQIPYYNI